MFFKNYKKLFDYYRFQSVTDLREDRPPWRFPLYYFVLYVTVPEYVSKKKRYQK